MSGIGGVFNLAGEAIESGRLNPLAAVLSRRGPDGFRIVCDGQIGLVHSHFWVTPEEIGEEQPLVENHLRLVADARIDNRSELLPVLKRHFARENPSDAEIILASYREWGEQCPRHLIGDFAFVIRDEDAQRLFCARDPVGIKPFLYSVIDDALVFGSDIGSILATLDTLPKANIPFIADLLAGRYGRWVNQCAFEGIFRLPPAYYMVADSHGVSLKRYWTFGASSMFHCKTDEEYLSCFRTLFMEAVRARSRSIGPVALTVSGGLDSSSIACTMQHLKSMGELRESCRIYSSVFHHTASGDEKDYLDVVLPACPDFPVTLIPTDDFWGLREFAEDNNFPLDDPETEIIRSSVLALLRKISQDGCRIVVSGYGGDQVLNTDAYSTPYTLKDIGLLRLPSELSYFKMYTPHLRELFAYSYITPLFPDALKTHLHRLIPDNSEGMFLTQACTDGVVPPDLLPPPRLPSRTSHQIYAAVNNGLNSVYRATLDTYAAYSGIDWRYPFYDRRVIDFMLSLPPRLSFRDGYSRCILRQSMKGMLPEPVRRRITKAHGGDLQARGMKERETNRVCSLINNSRAVQIGLIDPARLSRAWEAFRDTEKVPARPLVRYLCAEAWLRHYEKMLADQTGP